MMTITTQPDSTSRPYIPAHLAHLCVLVGATALRQKASRAANEKHMLMQTQMQRRLRNLLNCSSCSALLLLLLLLLPCFVMPGTAFAAVGAKWLLSLPSL